jgi:hypothetical protein
MILEFTWRGRTLYGDSAHGPFTDGVWRVTFNKEHDDWSAGLCSRRFALGSYGKTAEEALERHREFCELMVEDLREALK